MARASVLLAVAVAALGYTAMAIPRAAPRTATTMARVAAAATPPEPTLIERSAGADSTPAGARSSAADVGEAGDEREIAIAAISNAARGDVTDAITTVGATRLDTDGYVAAQAIRVLVKLSLRANASELGWIADRLAWWLEGERARSRSASDALGNVSILVEELAQVRHPHATAALVAALEAADLPLHIETRIVESLHVHAAPETLRAVEGFYERIPAPAGNDPFDDALRREARQVATSTRDTLSRE